MLENLGISLKSLMNNSDGVAKMVDQTSESECCSSNAFDKGMHPKVVVDDDYIVE